MHGIELEFGQRSTDYNVIIIKELERTCTQSIAAVGASSSRDITCRYELTENRDALVFERTESC